MISTLELFRIITCGDHDTTQKAAAVVNPRLVKWEHCPSELLQRVSLA